MVIFYGLTSSLILLECRALNKGTWEPRICREVVQNYLSLPLPSRWKKLDRVSWKRSFLSSKENPSWICLLITSRSVGFKKVRRPLRWTDPWGCGDDKLWLTRGQPEDCPPNPLTELQFVLVIGHGMDQPDGATRVADGLLHEVHLGADLLSLQLLNLLFPEVLMLWIENIFLDLMKMQSPNRRQHSEFYHLNGNTSGTCDQEPRS